MARSVRIAAMAVVCCAMLTGPAVAASSTLAKVKARGHLICGVSQGLPGFSLKDEKGRWSGLDVDFCRAVAAAVLGKAGKIKLRPLTSQERFAALKSRKVDILTRNTTWTLSRETDLRANFAGILYHDGQGFMTRRKLGVKNALELDGVTVCLNKGTTTEANIKDFFQSRGMQFTLKSFEKSDDALAAYQKDMCDVYTADHSALYAQQSRLETPSQHVILPSIISKEPLGPAVRHGDDQWFEIVKWTLFALINAEELGVTSSNALKLSRESKTPAIRRLLGVDSAIGKKLGLDKKWAFRAIRAIGNYDEMFERNLGSKSSLKIQRGINQLWSRGGILYAPPIR